MNNNDILIIGSVAIDSVRTPFGKRNSILGGSATYSALSASFFNKKISIVSVVGNDFPDRYIDIFEKRSIRLEGLKRSSGATFKWKGDYNFDLNSPETVYTHLNVFADFNPEVPQHAITSKFVFLANIDPDLQKSVLSQITKPRLIVCDTMNYWIERKRKSLTRLLKKVDIFLLNEGEARQLSSETNLIKAAKFIMSCGTPSVIIKKGEHGVLFFTENFFFSAPAYMLETIRDPTGAGDTFAGGFLGYLSQVNHINKQNVKKAIIFGSIMASFAVEDFGINRLFKLSKKDIERRYRKFKQITKF